jgi:hypothetical protein
MITRIAIVLCFLVAVSTIAAAQTEPVLASVNMPKYPALACHHRVQGIVKLAFVLEANSSQPKKLTLLAGDPLLVPAAVANIQTWRFDNPNSLELRYYTTFEYRLSGRELTTGQTKKLTVTFESFHKVEIVTDVYQSTADE